MISDTAVAVAIGATVGAFLIGSFIVGWLTQDLRVVDSLIVVAGTIGLTLLVYSALTPSGYHRQFVVGIFCSPI